jgi:hypothetical protein
VSSGGKRFCTDCVHRRTPPTRHATAEGSGLSPGRIQAATERMRIYQQRREIEHRRVHEHYEFDHRPHSAAWCALFTPNDESVAAIRVAVLSGDDPVLEEMRARGYEWTIDAANGEVRAVFSLCAYRNAGGDCPDFTARAVSPRP